LQRIRQARGIRQYRPQPASVQHCLISRLIISVEWHQRHQLGRHQLSTFSPLLFHRQPQMKNTEIITNNFHPLSHNATSTR
jgi:hypothetical protein